MYLQLLIYFVHYQWKLSNLYVNQKHILMVERISQAKAKGNTNNFKIVTLLYLTILEIAIQ